MAKRPQLNLTPPRELLEQLDEMARIYLGDEARRNEIAVEVLKTYLPFWEAGAAAKAEVINKQRRDAALSVLQGGAVELVGRHAETGAPTARFAGRVDEVGEMTPATKEQIRSAPNHGPQRARKRGGKKG
jgi:hypothetical protein